MSRKNEPIGIRNEPIGVAFTGGGDVIGNIMVPHRSKRKKSPLAQWRIDYAYISQNLRDLKDRIKSGADWGRFKGPSSQQAMLNGARRIARRHMMRRIPAAAFTAEDWRARQVARAEAIAAGKGHNSRGAGE